MPAFGTGGPSLPPFPLPTPDAAATPIVAPTVPSLPTPTWSTELPPLVEPTPTAPTVAVPSPIEVAAQRGEATAVASEAITASEPTPMAVPAQPTPIASPATPTPAASVPAPPAAPTIVPAPPTAPVAPSVPLRPLVPPPPMSPAQLVTAAPVPAPAPAKPAAVGPDGKRVINPFLKSDPQVRAKRLARALVSDMVAYQPQKRSEALANGTLKTVFKDEIRRSYDEYVDQVGREIAESTTYFQDALNEVLAEGKPIF
ncbi:MAG: hypothetical protein MUF21_13190 [Gemmatimonadaceae bacterium]|nr:hypothetical protein [Gemmatimonadaceae bacterium]